MRVGWLLIALLTAGVIGVAVPRPVTAQDAAEDSAADASAQSSADESDQDAQTVAREVTGHSDEAEAGEVAPEFSSALEIDSLERLTFRQANAGYHADGFRGAAERETPEPGFDAGGEPLAGSATRLMVPVADHTAASVSLNAQNAGYRSPVRRLPSRQQNGWAFACDPSQPEWRVYGEIGIGTGSATFADNEYQSYELYEELTTPSHKEFLFYQKYEVEHTYINSGEITIGARQRLPNVLWNGELKLTEEFRLYDDRNFDTNDRQEGLFDLRFDPNWNCGTTRADLSYRYNIKEREIFSPLSYKMHRGRLRLEQDLGCRVTVGMTAHQADYNYSIGSDRDNTRRGGAVDLSFRPSDDLTATIAVEAQEKQYEVRRTRDYEELEYSTTLRWRTSEDGLLFARAQLTHYDRPFSPDRSYDEQLVDLSYQHQLSREFGAEVKLNAREKDLIDPLDDLDQRGADATLTWTPRPWWSVYTGGGRQHYGYANVLRAFDRDRYRIGAQYSRDHYSFGIELQRQRNVYDADPNRDWTRDTVALNAGYSYCRHKLRIYALLGSLDQADPLSFNDYEESQLSAAWEYKLDCSTDLILSYDSFLRFYDVQDNIRDERIEARLRFEL